jgi:hypothetical protein
MTHEATLADVHRPRPQICVGVIVLLERLALARLLLRDLTEQTEPPAEVLVVLQGIDSDREASVSLTLGEDFPDLPLSVMGNPGQAVNTARNLILTACTSHVVLFMDDDARLPMEALDRVATAFQQRPEAAVITFKTNWLGEDTRPRRYPERERRRRTARSVTSVAAVEMAASAPVVRELGVRFDERFGPGGRFAAGDEFLFLIDVLRSDGVVWFVPLEIAEHKAQTGGRRMQREKVAIRGAMLRRAFGLWGLPAGWLFVARKMLTGELECTGISALHAIVDGWRAFHRSNDESAVRGSVA